MTDVDLKLDMLRLLESLPITNKTQVTDSKVMGVVERWSREEITVEDIKQEVKSENPEELAAKILENGEVDIKRETDEDSPSLETTKMQPPPPLKLPTVFQSPALVSIKSEPSSPALYSSPAETSSSSDSPALGTPVSLQSESPMEPFATPQDMFSSPADYNVKTEKPSTEHSIWLVAFSTSLPY